MDLAKVDSASYSDSSSESLRTNLKIPAEENHRQIDVNATKNPAVHRDSGPLSFAVTILRSCPLCDTLAILIVLLQIPPTFLSMIHLLFATLNFVPSSSIAASGLSYTDVLQGDIDGSSLTTALLLDFAVLLLWLILWNPVQNMALNLAQSVIALTLGGRASCRERGIKKILWCFGIVGASQFFRTDIVKNHRLRDFFSSNLSSTSDPDDPLESVMRSSGKRFGLIRIILAVHIITQGAVRYIQEWYTRREQTDHLGNIVDPEAGKSTLDLNRDPTLLQISENESSALLEDDGAIVSSKKKKNHCAQLRNLQPLWAALASTKIVMVKEYETSHAAAESAGSNATNMNNLGNAAFYSEADKIWITYIGSGEIFFSTSVFSAHCTSDHSETVVLESSTIDRSKPFYIKVNKTIWQPFKIYAKAGPDKRVRENLRWSGEIFGLAPMSNYDCEFISTVDESLLFSTNIRTLQPPSLDFAISPTAKSSACLSSSYSTLQTSVAQADKKLEEDRQRHKSTRKEFRTKINSIRKESERLHGNIASTGGNDDKMRQKIQQSTLHMKQADEATAILITQIEAIENTPNDEITLYSKSKSEIQSQRDKHKNVCAEISSRKHNAERELQTLKSDLSSLQQKSETKKQRLSILNARHESILDANARGLGEAQRRESEREVKRKERSNIQAFYTERLHSITAQTHEGQAAYQTVASAIEALLLVQQDAYPRQSPTLSSPNLKRLDGDSIPVNLGIASGNYPWNTSNALSGTGASCVLGSAISLIKPDYKSRDRSYSMLSNTSKFTQFSEDKNVLSLVGNKDPGFEDSLEDHKCHSGSASGSGSGSVGDPKSPLAINYKINSKGLKHGFSHRLIK